MTLAITKWLDRLQGGRKADFKENIFKEKSKKIAVKYSVMPDGSVNYYDFGMDKPVIGDLSKVMKAAAFNMAKKIRDERKKIAS